MNKAREILHFQKYLIKFWDQYALKKADPEMFSIWVNDIFAKKEALPGICGCKWWKKVVANGERKWKN